jgi:hypothetical protein
MSENYHRELSVGIMSGNYEWELSSENYDNYDLVYNITWNITWKS